MSALDDIFHGLWNDYAAITPTASQIHKMLRARGESWTNDHVAFRTWNLSPVGLESLAAPFLALGYQQTGEYDFAVKKLRARSYSLPGQKAPRVFISELLTEEFPEIVQRTARALCEHVAAIDATGSALWHADSRWAPVDYQTYQNLLEVSEYAAWLSVYGLRANHFTVSANQLQTFGDKPLVSLNAWLQAEGFALNESGGTIKGSPGVMLEQSSTLADRIDITFADGQTTTVPSCYTEFALRHPDGSTGKLFDGFVTQSADKIFESTDTHN